MSRSTKIIERIHEPVFVLENMENDRAAAVMAGAFLEYNLSLAVRARMRDLTQSELDSVFDNHGHGALQSLSQKIWVGYALNLYGVEPREDLIVLKNIRNFFAHDPEDINFHNTSVLKLCEKLKTPNKLAKLSGAAETKGSRERYMETIHFFGSRFHIIGTKNFQCPPSPPDMDLS
jgi:hypothetical protein